MIGFTALRWDPADRSADHAAESLLRTLTVAQWQVVVRSKGWVVLRDDRTSAALVRGAGDGSTVILGHLFDRRATEQSWQKTGTVPDESGTFADLCRSLGTACWGAYTAIGIDPLVAGHLSVFRDPIGMAECVSWRSSGVRLVSSRPESVLPLALPADARIRWDALGRLVRFPGSAGEALPLEGVTPIDPGTLVHFDGERSERHRIWSPAAAIGKSIPRHRPPEEHLPDLIDATVVAWAESFDTAIAEVSGGLDSAIVAAGLARARPGTMIGWLHYHAPDPGGDERLFARAVAERLSIPLEEVAAHEIPLDAGLVEDIPLGLRPSVASLSLFHDRDLAARARALGAHCLFTGQGGDAVFYQFATLSMAADLPGSRQSLGAVMRQTHDLARWTGSSVWAVAAAALSGMVHRPVLPDPHFPTDIVSREIPRMIPPLRWLDDAEHLPVSKQLQILQLAAARATFAPNWSSQDMSVVHPLLSQPIVEHMLSLSALELTDARRDRALIRHAYRARLPASLLARRGKGSVTSFYGRMLARAVPFLRGYLLDGALAAHRVLDRTIVEDLLDEDVLMQTNVYAEIFTAVFAERWARGWLGVVRA